MKLFVPGTGFEPAHPCERCHLKAVRLPISPPGLFTKAANVKEKLRAARPILIYTATLKSLNASFKLVFKLVLSFRLPMINAQLTL